MTTLDAIVYQAVGDNETLAVTVKANIETYVAQKQLEARIDDIEYIIKNKPTKQWIEHHLAVLKEQAELTKQESKE